MSNKILLFSYIDQTLDIAEVSQKHGNLLGIVVPENRRSSVSPGVPAYLKNNQLPLLVQPAGKSPRSPQFLQDLQALAPDLLITFSYSMILSAEVIAAATIGGVNIHNGKLPEYRGCHTINWAVANGETEAGVTLHWLDRNIDTGPVIAQGLEQILFKDTVVDLRDKLIARSLVLLDQHLPGILTSTAPRIIQDESRARYFRMRTPEDGLIDWNRPAMEIYNLIRALVAPWPGAYYFNAKGEKITFPHFLELEEVTALKKRITNP